jgi:hypothetical protein
MHAAVSRNLPRRLSELIHSWREACGVTDNDWFIIDPYSIGDAYHSLGLLPAFRQRHVRPGQRIVFLCNERCLPLKRIMPYADAYFSGNMNLFELQLNLIAEEGLFGPGYPVITAPDMHYRGALNDLVHCRQITMIDLKRLVMRVGFDTPFTGPMVQPAWREDVQQALAAQGVVQGESLMLFPHALTSKAIPAPFWNTVVGALRDRFHLFTDTTPGNAPLPFTTPIHLKLDALIPAVEWAGAALALRSGLSDVLSSVEATLVTAYPENNGSNFLTGPGLPYSCSSLSNMGLRTPDLEVRLSEFATPEEAALATVALFLAARGPERKPGLELPAIQSGPEAFLFRPDWRTSEWAEVLLTYFHAFHPGEPVALILPFSVEEMPLESVQSLVQGLLEKTGRDIFPDIVLVDDPESLPSIIEGYTSVQQVPLGHGAVEGLHGPYGTRFANARRQFASANGAPGFL